MSICLDSLFNPCLKTASIPPQSDINRGLSSVIGFFKELSNPRTASTKRNVEKRSQIGAENSGGKSSMKRHGALPLKWVSRISVCKAVICREKSWQTVAVVLALTAIVRVTSWWGVWFAYAGHKLPSNSRNQQSHYFDYKMSMVIRLERLHK